MKWPGIIRYNIVYSHVFISSPGIAPGWLTMKAPPEGMRFIFAQKHSQGLVSETGNINTVSRHPDNVAFSTV